MSFIVKLMAKCCGDWIHHKSGEKKYQCFFYFQSGHTALRMSFLSFFVFTFYSTESDETLTDFLIFKKKDIFSKKLLTIPKL